MEVIDKRKFTSEGEALASTLERIAEEKQYDDFSPTLLGCEPHPNLVLVRVLVLRERSAIASAGAFAEPSLYGEIVTGPETAKVVRFLKDVGTTLELDDVPEGSEYRLLHQDDIVCGWVR
jgi:hypothetical protein